jgi:sec-independent protein translocase protein TatA
MFGGRIGLMELGLILGIVLLMFGGRKIPEIAKGIGEGIRNFKKGINPEDGPQTTNTTLNNTIPENPEIIRSAPQEVTNPPQISVRSEPAQQIPSQGAASTSTRRQSEVVDVEHRDVNNK